MPATKAGGSVWKRRLIIALGCVIAYALLGFLAAPALLRWQGEIRLGELLQREVKIESVAINPFLLTLDVGGTMPGSSSCMRISSSSRSSAAARS